MTSKRWDKEMHRYLSVGRWWSRDVKSSTCDHTALSFVGHLIWIYFLLNTDSSHCLPYLKQKLCCCPEHAIEMLIRFIALLTFTAVRVNNILHSLLCFVFTRQSCMWWCWCCQIVLCTARVLVLVLPQHHAEERPVCLSYSAAAAWGRNLLPVLFLCKHLLLQWHYQQIDR